MATITKNKKYIYAVGRRKSSVAKVKLFENGKGEIEINGKKLSEYLPYFQWQKIVTEPLTLTDLDKKVDLQIQVCGGGVKGQAEAIRHGLARAIVKKDENLKKTLKVAGFLTRDPRVKERKKPGLKRARRAPQWSKR